MTYDVVIIGGGIHGAGVAQAAAAHGYSVLLLEKNDIADGTSSKSSKLIHGGLRYLESGQFSLVKECLYERQLLLKNAPHLVSLKPFIIPVYSDTSRGSMKIRVGLTLYSLLNGFKRSGQFQSISRKKWADFDGLNTNALQSVFQYWDAQTNDRLLTQAVIKSAENFNAVVKKNAEFLGAKIQNDNWVVRYRVHSREHEATAKVVINAAGPWVNAVNDRISLAMEKIPVDLVQGTHIILKGETTKGIYYLEALKDKRAIFVMPWYGDTMVGTTELTYTGDPDKVYATDDEINYLTDTVKHYFPKYASLNKSDIVNSFAGLRVLPADNGSAFSRSRETIIHEDKKNTPQLFSIYGGKLTAYRAAAEKVIRQIEHYLPQCRVRGDTKKIKLPE